MKTQVSGEYRRYDVVDEAVERFEKQLPLNQSEFELIVWEFERLGLCVAPSYKWVN
jgi:hypothetical protein